MATWQETEFLPAALEIEQSPPSPIGRALMWTIVLLFTAAIVWSTVGMIDIIAVAKGKTIPSGKSKIIQPLENGVVAAIYVRDGQEVRAGDVLIDLDRTATRAEEEKLISEYEAEKLEAARLRALLAGETTMANDGRATAIQRDVREQLLRDQTAERRAKLEAAQRQIEQKRAAMESTQADVDGLKRIVPLLRRQADAYRGLLSRQYIAEMQYLQAEQQLIDKEKEFNAKKEALQQDKAALAEAEQNYKALAAEYQRTSLSDLAEHETKAASLSQEIVKASKRRELQKLTAPIDGVVQQLAVHTIGGVVTAAQELMVVVPREHRLEVEASIENKDIGFVRAGQPVEIKVESFPFTLYGMISGHVISVSNDAVKTEDGQLLYTARVAMDRSTMPVNGVDIALTPGMAVTAEIATGQRRLIEFFLSPVLKGLQETARER